MQKKQRGNDLKDSLSSSDLGKFNLYRKNRGTKSLNEKVNDKNIRTEISVGGARKVFRFLFLFLFLSKRGSYMRSYTYIEINNFLLQFDFFRNKKIYS